MRRAYCIPQARSAAQSPAPSPTTPKSLPANSLSPINAGLRDLDIEPGLIPPLEGSARRLLGTSLQKAGNDVSLLARGSSCQMVHLNVLHFVTSFLRSGFQGLCRSASIGASNRLLVVTCRTPLMA
jgi:hypothetical protein